MWTDPIVAETRALREDYASQFNHDADAIFQDILRRQAEHPERLVSFPPRRLTPDLTADKTMEQTRATT